MSAPQGKVIITCAVTGSIHTPTMSPHLPIAPQEVAKAAIGAAEAGAAIVHLHARNPQDGSPSQDPDLFHEFLPQIAVACDAVINLTTGGAATMTIEDRLRPALELKPEVASLNMGSMNFGLYEMLKRYKDFKYDWEKPYLEGSDDRIFKNSVQGHCLHPRVLRGERYAFRDRVLRHRAPVHGGALSRSQAGQAAVVHPVGVRYSRRNRRAPRGRAAHEAHRGPSVRRCLLLVGARRGAQSDADRDTIRGHGWQRARRARGQPVARTAGASRSRTPSRSPRCGACSRSSAWRSQAPTMRARCSS